MVVTMVTMSIRLVLTISTGMNERDLDASDRQQARSKTDRETGSQPN